MLGEDAPQMAEILPVWVILTEAPQSQKLGQLENLRRVVGRAWLGASSAEFLPTRYKHAIKHEMRLVQLAMFAQEIKGQLAILQ